MNESPLPHDHLARILVDRIASRTGRRVRGLVVAHCHDKLTVRGTAESYYVWQLVIAACRESLAANPDVTLDCQFRVAGMIARSGSQPYAERAVSPLA
jgi:hypothetical protein